MDQTLIDRIREENNIIDVIGSYIPLKKYGANFKANCPFHDEKTPSFVVSEKKQIYRCFGCGKSGNVITFVRDYEKISFFESLKRLAERVGIQIQQNQNKNKGLTRQDLIFKTYELANNHYKSNLQKFGNEIKKYLYERDISDQTIEKFEIGYALNSFNALQNYLRKSKVNEKIFPYSGLLKTGNKGTYDFFRDRIMFPIHSITGRIVAFGGRIITQESNVGKYINSPTTDLYTKGDQLYGLYKTRYDIAKKENVLVSEGYMDFLRLYESGFENSVASLGTALTHKQIKLLSRYTKNFTLLYDGDKAGRAAAIKAGIAIVSLGFDAKLVFLPNDEDPDSFIVQYGAASLEKEIENAVSLQEALKDDTLLNLKTEQKIKTLMDTANNIQDMIKRELFVKEVSELFNIGESSLKTRLKISPTFSNKVEQKSLKIYPEERAFISILTQNLALLNDEAKEVTEKYFFSAEYKKIFLSIKSLYLEQNIVDISEILTRLDSELAAVLSEITLEEHSIVNQDQIIRALQINVWIYELKDIEGKIKTAGNDVSMDLLKRKIELKKKISKYYKSVTWKL